MRAGGPQKIEAVGLRLGQSLLVAEDYLGGIIFQAGERDESPPLELAARGGGESLGVDVDRTFGILAEDAFGSPLAGIGRSSGVDVIVSVIPWFAAAQDDAHQVVRAGSVVAFLYRGSDFVVGLGDDLRGGNSLRVIAESTEGMDVGHGKH